MSFTPGNDINILQGTDALSVGAGAGDDRYVLDASTLNADQQITISDTQGANTLQLVGGLEIVSSLVTGTAVQLVLNNGAKITVLGANTFNFQTGGNPLNGKGGVVQNFADFVTLSLGLAEVPTGDTPVEGDTVTVQETGGTEPVDPTNPTEPTEPTEPVLDTYKMAAAKLDVNEGEANTFTVTAIGTDGQPFAVTADTTVTLKVIPGSTTAADQGTETTNLNDFDAGAFNLVTKTIAAGQSSVSFDVATLADSFTELTETYQVEVKVGEQVFTKTINVLDGAIGAGKTYMLTTGADNIVGTAGNDTIRGDNTTLQATDVINGGAGTDTLEYTDARTTAVAGDKVPAALVSGVEVINVRNVNGTAAVAPTAEKATVTFADVTVAGVISATVPNTATIIIGGRTVTLTGNTGDGVSSAGASITFTAAQISSAFATSATTGLPSGITATGTVGAYTVTSASGSQVVFTSTGTGDVANLTVTGTGAGAQSIAVVDGTSGSSSTGANIEVTASNYAGATDFNSVNSLNKVTFTGLSATQKLGIVGNGTVANGDVDYTSAATTVINVSGGTKQGTVTNTGSNVTTATINSTGAANTLTGIDLSTTTSVTSLTINAATDLVGTTGNNGLVRLAADYAATAALTVNGAASSVALGDGATANFKTIDASGLTAGGLTIGLGTNTTSFKGGQGNDVVTTAALAATASVDAGAGTADVLVVGAATDTDTAAKGALYKGFEVLRTAEDQNMAHFSNSTITAIQMNATASKTLSNVTAAQAGNITVRGDQSVAFTVTLADATGTADVVGLTLSNPTATASAPADVDVAGFSIAGVETLNITSSGGDANLTGAQLNSVAFANGGADKLKTITVAGASSLDLSLTNTEVAVTVTSAQTGTGSLRVTGDVKKGSSITTTANKDDITVTTLAAGAAGDFITYDAGAGDDAISATAVAINNSVNTKASVKIDGGAGTDTLTFTDTALTLGDAQFQYITNIEKFVNSTTGTLGITTGGFFDANYKSAGAEFTLGETTTGAARSLDASSFTGNLKVTVSNEGTSNVSTVKTGSGNDTITLTQGTNSNSGANVHVVEAGLGNDTITAKNALVKITGGKGADIIDITDAAPSRDTIVIAAGDSVVGAHDKITGYATNSTAANSDVLDLAGTGVQGNVAAADGVDSGIVKSHSITGGIIKFDIKNAYDTELKVNASNLSDVLNYLKLNVTTDGNTVAFAYDSDNNGAADATIVFQAAADQANATVVELVGLTGLTSIDTTGGANVLLIA